MPWLTISRRKGQGIVVDGEIEILVTEVHRGSCKLAIRVGHAVRRIDGELPDERCTHHPADACCTECPRHAATDGMGFPHPSEARGRRALRRCHACGNLVEREWWTHDIASARFGCRSCFP